VGGCPQGGAVIADEIHLVADDHRGPVVERDASPHGPDADDGIDEGLGVLRENVAFFKFQHDDAWDKESYDDDSIRSREKPTSSVVKHDPLAGRSCFRKPSLQRRSSASSAAYRDGCRSAARETAGFSTSSVQHLDAGESEVIALCLEISDAVAVLDDRKARRVAHELRLKVAGTVGLLGLSSGQKRRGLVFELKPVLDSLNDAGFRMSRALYREALRLAGETD
jgi:hypothetical protein